MKSSVAFSVIVACFVIGGCDIGSLNSAPPSYIKKVAAYKEGADGIVVYMVLADNSGAETTASGTLSLSISQTKRDFSLARGLEETTLALFSAEVPVQQGAFQKASVGAGAFERKVILYSLGRIPYNQFELSPDKGVGKVNVEFRTTDGRVLKGEDTIFF